MSEFSDIWGRHLSYPFSYEKKLTQDTDRSFVIGDPSHASDPTWYSFCVNNDEMLKLTSAMQAGLDLLYPEDWQDLMLIWEQARQFPNDISFESCGGGLPENFCALVADCIENNENVRELIRELLEGGVYTEQDENAIGSNPLDCIWGGVFAIAEYVNGNAISWADLVVASGERLLEAIDIFTLTPIGFLIDFITASSTYTAAALSATWGDPDWVEERACELFCLQIATDNPQIMLGSTLEAWWGGNLIPVTEEVVWRLAARNLGVQELLKRWYLGSDECDNNWLLCDCLTYEQMLIEGDVSGNQCSTGSLVNGAKYTISITGTVEYDPPGGTDFFDAIYVTSNNWSTYTIGSPTTPITYDLGIGHISLIATPINLENHGYTFTVLGEGNPICFRVNDEVSDNIGDLTVEIVLVT